MNEPTGQEVFEVADKPAETPVETATPTRDELKAKGWSAAELEGAEKRGMIAKPEEKKLESKSEGSVAVAEPEKKTEEGKPAVERRSDPNRSTIPEFTFKTPEQEKAWLDAFGDTPQRAIYFRMKNERHARQTEAAARQAAEQERDRLKAEVEALKAKTSQEFDADGNPIDPDDKPLTLKQLKEIQQKEAEELERKRQENEAAQQRRVAAEEAQEEFARSVYPDFDDSVAKAKEIILAVKSQTLETMFPERYQQVKVINLIRNLQDASKNAEKFDLDDYHAGHIVHELGSLHPQYGKSAGHASQDGRQPENDGNPKRPETTVNGGLTPGQMKRMEENASRRPSSAAIPGGSGKRTVSGEDMDLKTFNNLSPDQRQRFRDKYPDRYAKLLRG